MTDMPTLRGLLATATSLITQRRFAEASELLDQILADPDNAVLGPKTALGLPRRLHAAQLKFAKATRDKIRRTALQYHLIPPPELLSPLFEVDETGRRARLKAAAAPVPRTVHQVWIGGPAPETTAVWRDHSARNGWDYRLWDEQALADLGIDADPLYRARLESGDFPGAVDIARYHILARVGGVYLDCDWMPVRDAPLDDAIPMTGLSVIAEETPRLTGTGSPFLNNSVIAAPPEHPAFQTLLSALPEVARRLPKGPAWWNTGPLVFTLACRAGPVTVLDAQFAAPMFAGDRGAVEAAARALSEQGSPAALIGWKPWDQQ